MIDFQALCQRIFVRYFEFLYLLSKDPFIRYFEFLRLSPLAARSEECHGPGPELGLELPFAPPWATSSSPSWWSSPSSSPPVLLFHHLYHEFKPSRWANLRAVDSWNPVWSIQGILGVLTTLYWLFWAYWVYWVVCALHTGYTVYSVYTGQDAFSWH